MKKISVQELATVVGGSNRQCLIDGILTGVGFLLGGLAGGLLGGLTGGATGVGLGNSDGCFG